MYDLLSIGSATLDVVAKSKDFVIKEEGGNKILCESYGEKMDVEEIKFISGGGATNVAVGCSRLGLKSAVVCEVGKDLAAQVIFDDLKKDKVETQYIIKERLEETAVSILLSAGDGGRSALTHRGAAYQLESRDIPWNELDKTRWLHFGTLGGDKQLLFDLFDFARQHQLNVSWTPSLKDLERCECGDLLPSVIYCHVLILNLTEWTTIKKIQEDLLKHIELIIVTEGKDGGVVYQNGKKLLTYESLEVKTVEETGAGDAFATGFIAGQLNSKTVIEAVEWGSRNAASVVQFLGAKEGLLTKSQIQGK
ncbi:MAG: carbohydrate kinase family protein [Patescibacteria group bacterium]